jgi:cytochrome d ubiquinol oxidase subunit I
MVLFGLYFIVFFIIVFYHIIRKTLQNKRWLLYLMLWTIPLVYLAGQAGWIVTEIGRQPWVIQDLLPTNAAVSMIGSGAVQLTFWLFAVLFTALLIAEVMIMTRQIKLGPKDGGTK